MPFLRSQRGYFGRFWIPLLATRQRLQHMAHRVTVQPDFTFMHPIDGAQDSARGFLFMNHAACAMYDRLLMFKRIARPREHKYTRRALPVQLLQKINALLTIEVKIQQDYVRIG